MFLYVRTPHTQSAVLFYPKKKVLFWIIHTDNIDIFSNKRCEVKKNVDSILTLEK